MEFLAEALINPYVLSYLLIVIAAQIGLALWHHFRRRRIARRRRKQGLPPNIIMDHTQRLAELQREAALEAGVLLLTVVLVPFMIIVLFRPDAAPDAATEDSTAQAGLALVFITLLLWVLLNGTDVAKAFLGGLAFKTLAAFHNPFQVGDRVTLKDHSGKVTHLGTFFVTLQTSADDLVNIPTRDLWSEVLVSANAGERSSRSVMAFYLDPRVTQEQRQAAEDAIWDAIQASTYFEPAKPMQIYLTQDPTAVRLTAKAYVTSTYHESLFTSDVTRAFLDFAAREEIPLALP